jgi:hydrogenase maturation protease
VKPCVVGIGHRDRGDDTAGLEVADRLRGQDGLDVLYGAADGPGLLTQIEDRPLAVFVDSARGGGAVGSILRLQPGAASHGGATSSHGNALAEALALGDALGCLPTRLAILAVVGERFGIGDAMSPSVRAALPALAAMALEEATCTKPG